VQNLQKMGNTNDTSVNESAHVNQHIQIPRSPSSQFSCFARTSKAEQLFDDLILKINVKFIEDYASGGDISIEEAKEEMLTKLERKLGIIRNEK